MVTMETSTCKKVTCFSTTLLEKERNGSLTSLDPKKHTFSEKPKCCRLRNGCVLVSKSQFGKGASLCLENNARHNFCNRVNCEKCHTNSLRHCPTKSLVGSKLSLRLPHFWDYSLWRIILLMLLLNITISISGVSCNLCLSEDQDTLLNALRKSVLPKGGAKAGVFKRLPSADSLGKCIMGCCLQASCNAMFFHNSTCYTIVCDAKDVHSCDPSPRSDPKYANSYYINLRSLEDTAHVLPEVPSEDYHVTPEANPQDCSQDNNQCPENEKCQLDSNEFVFKCICKEGFLRNPDTKICEVVGKACTFGLQECAENEECLVRGTRSKHGRCHCVTGYDREASSGTCQRTEDIVSSERETEELHSTRIKSDSVTSTHSPTTTKVTSGPLTTTTTLATTTTKPASTTTTTPKVIHLTVSAGENQELVLPKNEITLAAYVIPKPGKEEEYHYEWSLLSGPDDAEKGVMADKNTDTLKLSKLIEGVYGFRVVVTGPNKYGEAFVNVTVKPAAKTKQPPVAVINPKSQSVVLPKSPILDGSESDRDDNIVSYHWEEVNGPIQGHQIEGDEALLKLTDLVSGNYTFKLTVTDKDGDTSFALANVTVIKETDYPPKAFVGSDIVIYLPQNEVTLYGNGSSDDKGIKSYEWLSTGQKKLTANTEGVHKPILHLSGLEEGNYAFKLTVTDTADQTDHKTINIFVKKAKNRAPVSNPGPERTLSLPLDNLPLDGRNSTDDKAIVKFQWTFLNGASPLTIQNDNKPVATATGDIKKGDYTFRLTVIDEEGEENSGDLTIHIVENPNKPPVADAGGDQTVYMPQALVCLNGSKSSDDYGIVTYLWTRDLESLATGDILNGSDHKAVLLLTNTVPGRYVFKLEVTDKDGITDTDTATVTVKPDPHLMDLLELRIRADLSTFTEQNKINLEDQLALLLHTSTADGKTKVKITQLLEEQMTGHLLVRFYVMNVAKEQAVIQKGVVAAHKMKAILYSKASILDYSLVSVDTSVCQNNCSGHGVCDPHTKTCVCEAFWMENFFKAYLIHKERNCDWSILYVVIVTFVSVVSVVAIIWLLVYCCRKRSRCRCLKTRRRHRYTLLHETDDKEEIGMIPKASKLQQSSLMMSDSDFTSEEETLFISQKKGNGVLPKRLNGIARPYNKNKTKA